MAYFDLFPNVELPSFCICFEAFKEAINCQRKIPKAVMLMSANGRYPSYEMNEFLSFCTNKGIKVIESAVLGNMDLSSKIYL